MLFGRNLAIAQEADLVHLRASMAPPKESVQICQKDQVCFFLSGGGAGQPNSRAQIEHTQGPRTMNRSKAGRMVRRASRPSRARR